MLKINKKRINKWSYRSSLAIVYIVFLLFVLNFFTLLSPPADHFNIFHRYDKVHSLLDWNLPHKVSDYIDSDNTIDTITSDGCVFLTTVDSIDSSTNERCISSVVDNGQTHGYPLPTSDEKIIHTYVGKKNNSWEIVTISLYKTRIYQITSTGIIPKKDVPLTLSIDSILYRILHIYAW